MYFFDDGDAPNAFAIRKPMDRYGPDGTVFIGINLVETEWRRIDEQGAGYKIGDQSLMIFLAHEFAHILQYKKGMSPSGPWQMEPHADFMAGWCLRRLREEGNKAVGDPNYSPLDIEQAVSSIFGVGDTDFYDRDHHGEPEFRAAMVRAGYDAYKLDVQAAFEKGRKMAGLK